MRAISEVTNTIWRSTRNGATKKGESGSQTGTVWPSATTATTSLTVMTHRVGTFLPTHSVTPVARLLEGLAAGAVGSTRSLPQKAPIDALDPSAIAFTTI